MSRVQKLRERNNVCKLLKDLNKRMNDFENTVDELKILKESVLESYDQITEQEASNVDALQKLRNDLENNKLKVLNDAASSMGKKLLSEEEIREMEENVHKLKEKRKYDCENLEQEIEHRVSERVDRQLEVQKLKHECENASVHARVSSLENEIENLNAIVERMSTELESQKQLTADVARANRPAAPEK